MKMFQKCLSSKLFLLLTLVFTTAVYFLLQNVLVTKLIVTSVQRSISLIYPSKQFNPDDKSVLVFLHVQKTGGSDFDRAIVKHLMLRRDGKFVRACTKNPLQVTRFYEHGRKLPKKSRFKAQKFKKYQCVREVKLSRPIVENWYFSRQTFGWICGLHPDINDLRRCVYSFYPQNSADDFHFFTILREPFHR